MSDVFSEIYRQAGKYNNAHPGCMENTFYQLYSAVSKLFPEEGKEKFRKDYYYTYLESKNFQQIFQKLFLFFSKFIEEEQKKLKEKWGKPLAVAVGFIKKHYMESISQEEVAEAANISTTYLSKLFREEMKIGFNEYVTQVRLEEAKNLLSESNISIKEIASMTEILAKFFRYCITNNESLVTLREEMNHIPRLFLFSLYLLTVENTIK